MKNKTINRKISTRITLKISLCDKNSKKKTFVLYLRFEKLYSNRFDLSQVLENSKEKKILMFVVEMLSIENRKQKSRAFVIAIFINISQKMRIV